MGDDRVAKFWERSLLGQLFQTDYIEDHLAIFVAGINCIPPHLPKRKKRMYHYYDPDLWNGDEDDEDDEDFVNEEHTQTDSEGDSSEGDSSKEELAKITEEGQKRGRESQDQKAQ
ncbi:hypothetical protein M409DRAFT_31133 [Zasmidium cellare ATCC 36951]|uniref:Uncharacterized protein n=1 Tax=Zasmidium cellare ATCC 36951 TaxID=1080233 RepID=A0A6A6BXS4_ZASCE|nr:uncharacterized protein M409DRAFT_31133 [Zasmidium cellare ATCC 36951]KAF2158339.1 hypothetical protein M409DRAFT_31133 [Zasmidium cellare ATCC 36951]